MRQYNAKQIRNIALAGHGNAGKTSLAEALLFKAGATDRLGKVIEANTICDFDPEETRRKVSVSMAVAPLEWGNTKINLLDTPGLFDFATGFYEGVRACDSVLIALSGKSGVSVGTEKAYKLAGDLGKSRMFVVTKLDAEHADFYKVLEGLKAKFGPSVCPLVVPHYVGNAVESYINLIDMKAYVYDAAGNPQETPMPDAGHRIDGLVAAISEAIAETDEELFEKYFSGEQFTVEEITAGVKKGIKDGTITPVLGCSAFTMEAVDTVLNTIAALMPSAEEASGETGETPDGGAVEIPCDENAPLAAYVFKTVADPFVGKLSYVKVISGRLSADQIPVNSTTEQPERLGKIIYLKGKKQEDTSAIVAGDIGAVTKLSETRTGDTLYDPKRPVKFAPSRFPEPCLSMAIAPKTKGDEGKIAQSIQRLIEEDPSISYVNNVETHQQVISGLGEQHLDVLVSKLKSKFGVEVTMEEPRVPYRETIRKKVKVQGKHKKQSGGHGQYGDVWIEFEPWDCEDLDFQENVFGGSVPRNFFPAVEKGLRDCIKKGVLAGYPVVGLRATLVDGSYHPVDSSEMSFKMAASIAYKEGLAKASPCILEPVGTLSVYAPDSNTGDIMGDLNKRRGRVLGMNPAGDGLQEVVAEVPMSEMADYSTFLRSLTQGRGSFSLKFERYEQLPANLEPEVIEAAKALRDE
ncbi:MAG: elongation factor G [Oscillospiraceae bacterium]|nr:elongation factor G [Oscillospiraceae bacterium]